MFPSLKACEVVTVKAELYFGLNNESLWDNTQKRQTVLCNKQLTSLLERGQPETQMVIYPKDTQTHTHTFKE